MDTPYWYYTLVYRKSGHFSLKNSILHFCGIRPVRFTVFTPVRKADEKTRSEWLKKVDQLGRKLK
jgi:putative NADPH-quinone reductase